MEDIKEEIEVKKEYDTKSMNIYEKLQFARTQLLKIKFKKSGKNDYAGFDYYELGDFLPDIIKIFKDLKLFSKFDIKGEEALLTIVDIEKPDDDPVVFRSPYVKAVLRDGKGGEPQPIQGLGASHTYLRRYLYINALEITEFDTIDRILNESLKNAKTLMEKCVKYIRENYTIFRYEIEDYLAKNDIKGVDYLLEFEAEALCSHIKDLKELKRLAAKSRDPKK